MDFSPQLTEILTGADANQPALRFGDLLYPAPFRILPDAVAKVRSGMQNDSRFDLWRMIYQSYKRDRIQEETRFSKEYVSKLINGDSTNDFLGLTQLLEIEAWADSARALQTYFFMGNPEIAYLSGGRLVDFDAPGDVLQKIQRYKDGMKTWALYALGYSQPQISQQLGIAKTAYYARINRIFMINSITEEECAKRGLDAKLVLSAMFWQTAFNNEGMLENLDWYNKD